jgi:hypothetical protein
VIPATIIASSIKITVEVAPGAAIAFGCLGTPNRAGPCRVGPAVEKQAFEVASRRQHMSEIELQQEEAQEREAEIERNRRRPGRRAPYPC